MTDTVTIDPRYCGPSHSASGGYTCGLLAGFIGGPAEVTLRTPPPLSQTLRVVHAHDLVLLITDDNLIAEARAATVELDLPKPVSFDEARLAESRYPWRHSHPYATCFVCGPHRNQRDALRIFPGSIDGRPIYAARWLPAPALATADGRVRDEFIWAALDCPSGIVTDLLGDIGLILLGRLAVEIHQPLTAESRYVVQARPINRDGRKLNIASALLDVDGRPCATARATWIELRESRA
jgi:hypothetical protein